MSAHMPMLPCGDPGTWLAWDQMCPRCYTVVLGHGYMGAGMSISPSDGTGAQPM